MSGRWESGFKAGFLGVLEFTTGYLKAVEFLAEVDGVVVGLLPIWTP